MVELFTQIFTFIAIVAVLVIAITLAHKSQARVWRLLGWFACVWALTLIMWEGYAWYLRGDWQIKTAYAFWDDINRSSRLWLSNNMPEAIWWPIDVVLDMPAWLVLIGIGVLLLAFDHWQLQKSKIGEKKTLRKRLKDWLRKMQQEEEEEQA